MLSFKKDIFDVDWRDASSDVCKLPDNTVACSAFVSLQACICRFACQFDLLLKMTESGEGEQTHLAVCSKYLVFEGGSCISFCDVGAFNKILDAHTDQPKQPTWVT